MRILAPLLLLIALGAEAPAPATIDTLAPDAEARWIAFDLTPANQIRFTVQVDETPVAAILDTGVSYSALSRRFAAARRMRIRTGAPARAIGGTVASGWVDTRRVTLGALTRAGGRMTVSDLPASAIGGGPPVDMLVGRDLTAGYALDIDYDARRFRLLPSGRLPFRGSTAPLRIAGEWPSYVSDITVGPRRLARIAIDTGDGTALTLTRAAWESLGLRTVPVSSTIGYGIGGATIDDLAILPLLRSGDTVAHDVETRIEPDGGYAASIGMAGRLGSGFLQGYRVLLDPGAGRMVLRPGGRADAAPVRSTSGLLLRAEPTRLTVLHVMRGSPAAAGGWRVGEQICAVDGTAQTPASPLRWPVGEAGRVVALGLCGGAVRLLTLRRFY